ncbi:MAG: YdcF family protein, partial [Clostridia bacterium]
AAVRGGYVRIPVYALSPGEAEVTVATEDETISYFYVLKVDSFRMVYDPGTGNFTGDTAALSGITLFWLMVGTIMLWYFFRAKGMDLYDYGTIYYAGFSLFAFATGLVMLSTAVSRLAHPESSSMYSAYAAISGASIRYMMLTTPLMVLFAGAVAVSNIALLRHERPRPQNVLGLLLSLLLLIGEAVGWYLFTRNSMGSDWQGRLDSALQNTYATAFIYCQCMLTGAAACGIRAARHIPAADKDFIIILGCWFRPDGTLPPLLRGRADRAIAFWRGQREKTGKEACFIPSGGQGSNEPIPEAEAIRQYLLSQGIEDRLILPEPRSVNTLQNMAFSRQIIRNTDPEGKAVFATSSYHVFRSGLWAKQAGLSAEGVGSRTKWWFWPNAFIRETAGLLQKRWKQEVCFLLLLIAFFDVLSMVL